MGKRTIDAAMGRIPFDLAVRNVKLVNVLTDEIYEADLGIVDGEFAFAGKWQPDHTALETIDGEGRLAVPGLIDSHMHIESSMMTPAHFAQAVLPLGTTTVAADPHEIGNVLGVDGARILAQMSRDLPLHVYVMAPSTIPSAPGFETAGADVEAGEVAKMLALPGVHGLGEVMDFLGVIAGDEKMMGVIDAAKEAGVLLDGHVPTLRGRELQAFAASGIDCDHTVMDPAIVADKLRAGIAVQIQERFFTRELMAYLNACPVQNNIMLVTDDVPISRLAAHGHLGTLVRHAISLGLDPKKALRFTTSNPAQRLRLPRAGAIAPGRRADLLLLDSLEDFAVYMVFSDGKLVAREGKLLAPLASPDFPPEALATMRIGPLAEADFAIPCQGAGALVNLIEQDGKTSRTVLRQGECKAENGRLLQGPYAKMAVFERHTGQVGRGLGLLSNMEGFCGALATTYAHDCHNLCVYSGNDADAVKAANLVIGMGGGIAAVLEGEVLCAVPLPIGGILCQDPMEELAEKFEALNAACRRMKLNHQEPLTFLTLMALAVSPNVKLTDRGLVDVTTKTLLPLVVKEN